MSFDTDLKGNELPERDIDKTGLGNVETVNYPEDRWKTGDLDEKDTPLSCQPSSPSKTGYQTHGKCSPNGKKQDNRFKSQEHYPSAPITHLLSNWQYTQWSTQTPLHCLS
jgi:hypothetical protein